jgi:hypothetical protein
MSAIAEILQDLLISVAVTFTLFIVLIVVVSKLPDGNPLKRILYLLSWRVGVTLGAGVVAVPVEPIPGLDALYDVGVPLALIYYWVTFFRAVFETMKSRDAVITIDHSPPQ